MKNTVITELLDQLHAGNYNKMGHMLYVGWGDLTKGGVIALIDDGQLKIYPIDYSAIHTYDLTDDTVSEIVEYIKS